MPDACPKDSVGEDRNQETGEFEFSDMFILNHNSRIRNALRTSP